jgi:hypothetical protein
LTRTRALWNVGIRMPFLLRQSPQQHAAQASNRGTFSHGLFPSAVSDGRAPDLQRARVDDTRSPLGWWPMRRKRHDAPSPGDRPVISLVRDADQFDAVIVPSRAVFAGTHELRYLWNHRPLSAGYFNGVTSMHSSRRFDSSETSCSTEGGSWCTTAVRHARSRG